MLGGFVTNSAFAESHNEGTLWDGLFLVYASENKSVRGHYLACENPEAKIIEGRCWVPGLVLKPGGKILDLDLQGLVDLNFRGNNESKAIAVGTLPVTYGRYAAIVDEDRIFILYKIVQK